MQPREINKPTNRHYCIYAAYVLTYSRNERAYISVQYHCVQLPPCTKARQLVSLAILKNAHYLYLQQKRNEPNQLPSPSIQFPT